MKQIKRIMIVVLVLVLAVSLSLTAFAATASQDGLELLVTTDKTSYSATEQVTVTVTVKNTNAFAVSNVAVESNVPDGYKPAEGYSSTKNIATLGAGETTTLTVVYVPQSSGQSSGPSYPTYPPYPWYSGNTSNTGDAEETEEVVEIDQPTEGNTNVFEEVTVTAKCNVGLWILIAVVSAGALIAVIAGKKRLKKTMSIMLCIAMVGTLAAVLPVEVNAAVMPLEAGGVKNLSAETEISVAGKNVNVSASVQYVLDSENPNPITYTVTFAANGENVENLPEPQKVKEGECAVEPVAPSREEYDFTGWYTDEKAETPFDFSSKITSDIVLYAGWEEIASIILNASQNNWIQSLNSDGKTYFYAECNKYVDSILLFDSDNNEIAIMQDTGDLQNDGDRKAGDGIYSALVQLNISTCGSFDYYASLDYNKEFISNTVNIRVVSDLTSEEYESEEYVDSTITELLSSEAFQSSDDINKKQMVKDLLQDLSQRSYSESNGSYITECSIWYDEETNRYYFSYGTGSQGSISFDIPVEGCIGTYIEEDSDSNSQTLTSLDEEVDNNIAETKGIIMYGITENLNTDEYTRYEKLADVFEPFGFKISICNATVDNFKQGLLDYDFIDIECHGSLKKELILNSAKSLSFESVPVFVTFEKVNSETDKKYRNDLNSHRIDKTYFAQAGDLKAARTLYEITPQFFEHYYSDNKLKGSLTWLGCCEGYGVTNNEVPALSLAFKHSGSDAILAHVNEVFSGYDFDLMKYTLAYMINGDSFKDALAKAENEVGSDDGIWAQKNNVSRNKAAAYNRVIGNDSAYLENYEKNSNIQGKTIDEAGNPISANIELFQDEFCWYSGMSNSETGSFNISAHPGNYELLVYKSGYTIEGFDSVRIPIALPKDALYAITDPFVFTEEKEINPSISGTVVDSVGNGIENVRIQLYTEDINNCIYEIYTEPDGKFKISLNENGTYNVLLSKEGYTSKTINNIEVVDEDNNIGNVVLNQNSTGISGIVIDSDQGVRLEGVEVSVYDETDTNLMYAQTTDEYGYFYIGIEAAGNYVVHFDKEGYDTIRKEIYVIDSLDNSMGFISLNDGSSYNFSGGDGTKDNPYLIETAEQLNAVRNDMSANYVLSADIDLSNYGSWDPIGTVNKRFTGSLDGNNHKIIGLTINNDSVYKWATDNNGPADQYTVPVGLFGILGSKASVRNIVFENYTVSVGNTGYVIYSGAVAGYLYINSSNITISNCIVNGTITLNTGDDFGSDVGGIVGAGVWCTATISNCINNAPIDVSGYGSTCGGIAGYMNNATIELCVNNADVQGLSEGSFSTSGGIIGNGTFSTVSKCDNFGNISTRAKSYTVYTDSENSVAGGIAGSIERTIDSCNNYGDVYAEHDVVPSAAGGICGEQLHNSDGYISNCTNYGKNIKAVYRSWIDKDKGLWEYKYGYAARICGYAKYFNEGLLRDNKSISTTIVNGAIPTEHIGPSEINGESIE